jgi:hypothetical protein
MRTIAVALGLALLPLPAAADLIRADGSVDRTRYHDSREAEQLLRELAARFPELARLFTIGKSYGGQELWVLELTNRKTGAAADKPGYYVDGGVHSCELAGSEQVLYLAWFLATRHGRDADATLLLDTRTLYLRPKFNPDGADYCMSHPDSLRSTPRPWDDDGDGLRDEDPAEDLDGDGAITTMRVPSSEGTHRISKDDARIMVEAERRPGEPARPALPPAVGGDRQRRGRVVQRGRGRRDHRVGAGAVTMRRVRPDAGQTLCPVVQHRNRR